MATTTASRKAKGRRLQDYIKHSILSKFLHLEPDDVKCAIMGESGQDLKLSPLARKTLGVAIEAKNVEKINIWQAIKQAEDNAAGQIPVVVFSRNKQKFPYAALPLDVLLELLRVAYNVREKEN